jgi:hypothetical protein
MEPLTEGLTAEPVVLDTVFRIVIAIWALVLLLFGHRLGRGVAGTFFLAIGLGFGSAAAGISLPLGLLVAFAIFAVGMALFVWVPRLAMALALSWPLPMVYIAHLFFVGSFDRSKPLLIGLAVVGALLGAILPRFGRIPLSSAIGALLLLLALPLEPSRWLLFGPMGAAIVWQIVSIRRQRRRERNRSYTVLVPERSRGEQWRLSLAGAGTVIVLATLWIMIGVPRYSAGTVPEPARLQMMEESGRLGRPGLVIGTHNNFYLSGRPVRTALVHAQGRRWSRITFWVSGRNLTREVMRLRTVKNEAELEAMRRAAAITSRAFADIEPMIRPGVNEAEIEARILRTFAENGATGVAFKSIVGSGPNAVLPHYERNDAEMTEGLVVIDIGCEIDHYASDMTRTFPVNGELGAAEDRLFEIVIAATQAAREALKPGAEFGEVHDAAMKVIEDAGFGDFFTHRVGHHVGLNVHDPGDNPLTPGMVVTIEPGIYVPEGADVDPKFWNLGVRIEDSYVVTEDGWEAITSYPWWPGEARREAAVVTPLETDAVGTVEE